MSEWVSDCIIVIHLISSSTRQVLAAKAETLKSDYDQAMIHFEQCQVLTRFMHNLHFSLHLLIFRFTVSRNFFSQDAYETELFAYYESGEGVCGKATQGLVALFVPVQLTWFKL